MLRKPLIVLAQLSAELQELSWLRFFGGCYFGFWWGCYFAIWTVSGFRIMCPVILSPNVASFWLFRYTLSGLDGVIIPIIGATAISLVVYLLCMVLLAMRWPVGVGDLLLAIFVVAKDLPFPIYLRSTRFTRFSNSQISWDFATEMVQVFRS